MMVKKAMRYVLRKLKEDWPVWLCIAAMLVALIFTSDSRGAA